MTSGGPSILLIAAGSVVALAICLYLFSPRLSGPKRLGLVRAAIYLGLPGIVAVLVLAPQVKDVPWGDGLSIAGLLVAIVFGLWSDALDGTQRGIRVGIVIPSRAPFHSELRSGLRRGLSGRPVTYIDQYLIESEAPERLSEFMPCLRSVLTKRPDYVIVACPALHLANSGAVEQLLRPVAQRGGGVVFVDNSPDPESSSIPGRRMGSVTTDMNAGAGLIARYVEQLAIPASEVLVVGGARDSAPAQERQSILREHLPAATFVDPVDGGWTRGFGERATAEHLATDTPCRAVICGNDTMALGACEAVREAIPDRSSRPIVVGFDGLRQALFAIEEREHPLAATIMTPPSAYGEEIAAMILDDLANSWTRRTARRLVERRGTARFSGLRHCLIPVSESQLVTSDNIAAVAEP